VRQSWRLDRVTTAEGRERKARLLQLRAMEQCVAAGLWIGVPAEDLAAPVYGIFDREHGGRRALLRSPDAGDDRFVAVLERNDGP